MLFKKASYKTASEYKVPPPEDRLWATGLTYPRKGTNYYPFEEGTRVSCPTK